MILPKPHLSFSQIQLWLSSRDGYRKRYYPQEKTTYFSSPEMEFGNTVTLAMEKGEEWTKFIPRYKTFEHKLLVEIEGIPILGYIDNINLKTLQFAEQKTGRTKWTQKKVDKHLQLDLYSLLLHEKYGKVKEECYLLWVETEKIKKKVMMGDIELEGDSTDIGLTGNYTMFPRTITKKDREKMRSLIVKVAAEIELDYLHKADSYQRGL